MWKVLFLAAVLPIFGQIDTTPAKPDPASKVDPTLKQAPVSPEPQLACAGNRPELLVYPNAARAEGMPVAVTADFNVTPEGKLKDSKLTSDVNSQDKSRLFEEAVQLYLQQSDYPPGCEGATKQLVFKFFIKGEPASDRKGLVEYKAPKTFEVSVNPDAPSTPPTADRKEK